MSMIRSFVAEVHQRIVHRRFLALDVLEHDLTDHEYVGARFPGGTTSKSRVLESTYVPVPRLPHLAWV
eukprot:CAMPEP_0173066924 /NCGR_PEP_ID=MMETSP1102-20130122/6504_1 /TAXON_ID=49646 /ORGANISM="Geminigera sp., Strain Caron Lab Isolate" /LENGTH=67 /DNA_ID=CAMNT_0013934481 /DNA_START=162 /DNA_END=362 /DNA_ORIENTATION=-